MVRGGADVRTPVVADYSPCVVNWRPRRPRSPLCIFREIPASLEARRLWWAMSKSSSTRGWRWGGFFLTTDLWSSEIIDLESIGDLIWVFRPNRCRWFSAGTIAPASVAWIGGGFLNFLCCSKIMTSDNCVLEAIHLMIPAPAWVSCWKFETVSW